LLLYCTVLLKFILNKIKKVGNMSQSKWKVVRAGMHEAAIRPQKYFHLPGVNKETVGSEQIAVNLVVLPPKAVARGHIHHKHETVIFVIRGWSLTFMGAGDEVAVAGPGEFLYISKDTGHLAVNLSDDEPVVGLICRSDPELYTNMELLPYLDEVAAAQIEELRALHAANELPKGWKEEYRKDFNIDAWVAVWQKFAEEHGVKE
jgi:uncharacterized RmlC-like cupin family protein